MTNSIIQSILGAKTLSYNTLFAKALGGNVPAAVFLSQAFFWQEKAKYKSGIDFDSEGYFSKTAAEWHEETGLSTEQQKTARVRLVEAKILLEKRAGLPAKMYFKIDIEALVSGISGYLNTGVTVSGFSVNLKPETREAGSGRFRKLEAGNPASNYIDRELKESKESKKESNADADAPLAPPYRKTGEIEIPENNFSLKAEKEKNLQSGAGGGGAPGGQNGAAVRISLTDPDLPGVEIIDEVKPEPQTPPEKTGRGKAKNGRSENAAWTKRAAELFDLVSSENGCPDFNWKINAGRDFKALKDIRAAMAADIEKKQSRAATEEEYERGFEYLFRTGYKYLAEIANGRGGVVQFSPMTIKNCYNQILNYGRNAGKSPAGTKSGEHLNAAQRQHLNLANYIAQRRLAAMERAANGGTVD